MDAALRTALDELATHASVVVGVDFDGTLAPLDDKPMEVRPVPGALEVLDALADLPGVTVAVVSGRALGSLHQLTRATHPLVLIGSHGAESSIADAEHHLSDADSGRLEALVADLTELADRHPQARLEHKPSAVVLHTRGMPEDAARAATQEAQRLAAEHDGVRTTPGKDVLEMSVTEAGKGASLLDLADELGATAILYAGDDVTDERAFAELRPVDVTIKVGTGDTCAQHRVADEHDVVGLLEHLLQTRLGK